MEFLKKLNVKDGIANLEKLTGQTRAYDGKLSRRVHVEEFGEHVENCLRKLGEIDPNSQRVDNELRFSVKPLDHAVKKMWGKIVIPENDGLLDQVELELKFDVNGLVVTFALGLGGLWMWPLSGALLWKMNEARGIATRFAEAFVESICDLDGIE